MNDNGQTEADLKKRIAQLEAELEGVKRDRAKYRELLNPDLPIPPDLYEPITEEEAIKLLNEPHCGKSISDLVAEFETQMDR